MILQTLVVALLVVGCTCYSAWVLMPAAARSRVARSLLQMRLPAPWAERMRRHVDRASGCGCDGCDHGTKTPVKAASVRVVRIHRRPSR